MNIPGPAPGPKLAAHNRPILARRFGWPAGAVLVCEYLDHQHPGWHTTWMHACAWNGRPAGWYGRHVECTRRHLDAYGQTPDELRAAIRAHRCPPLITPWLWGS